MIFALASFSVAASTQYPDSTQIGGSFGFNISHKINGKAVGNNPQTKVTYGNWSSWETSSHMTSCSPWSPNPNTVNWGTQFIQTNICYAEETRHRDVTYSYSDGTSRTETEYETISTQVDDEQYAIGTKDYILRTEAKITSWVNSGSIYSCTSWSPLASNYNQGVKFTQTRQCKQDQTRQKIHTNVWASGKRTTKSSITERQTISIPYSRQATGTKIASVTKWVTITKNSTNRSYSINGTTTVTDDSGKTYSNAKVKEVKIHWSTTTMLPYKTTTSSQHITESTGNFSMPLIANSVVGCAGGRKAISTVYGEISKAGNAASFKGGFDTVWNYDGCESEASIISRKVELKLEVKQ